ncbi:MAG: hypothetical protein JWO89_150 [Verrucomicrobiaceae bacterium]|nr:hypothetical protein [Verrucomicrobiaceae bacterium]MDB6116938.1 hypothetical protein [Verrucomicrobiaceae bacterium]
MKPPAFQALLRRPPAGFSLVEVSTALGVMMVLAISMVIMLQQHAQFLEMFRRQSFLASEAPKIGNLLGRIINESDHYFVYADKAAALGGGQPLLTDGKAVRLFFKSPNHELAERLITVEDTAAGAAMRFYNLRIDGSQSSWTISDRIAAADFRSDQGILNVTLTGPHGEQVAYGGGAR